MLSLQNIFDTIAMVDKQHLDIRTITMGISLLDCADDGHAPLLRQDLRQDLLPAPRSWCRPASDIEQRVRHPHRQQAHLRHTHGHRGARPAKARTIVPAGADAGQSRQDLRRQLYRRLFRAGAEGLHHRRPAAAWPPFPEALAQTELVCSSVNVGTTKAGINMDAVAQMGRIIKETAHLTRRQDGLGCAKLVVFCNAVEDNPFMAGRVPRRGRGRRASSTWACPAPAWCTTPCSSARASPSTWWPRPSKRPPSRSPAWGRWWRPGGQPPAGCALRHRGSVAGSHPGGGRQRGPHSGGDGSGRLRHPRHHRGAGAAERRREEGRRHGQRPCGRSVRRVYPRVARTRA